MASTQGSAIASFEFSDYIEDEPKMSGEDAEDSSTVTAPAKASVDQGHTATDAYQASGGINNSDRFTNVLHEAADQCGCSETEGMVSNGKMVSQPPGESSECVQEPVKTPQLPNILQKVERGANLPSGTNPENLVDSNRSYLTPPASTIPVSPYGLRNRTQSKLVYDIKYHPMDDTIRPSQAAKRRQAHGEAQTIDSDDLTDAYTVLDAEANSGESSDTQSEEKEEISKQSKKARGSKQAKLHLLPVVGTRCSTRKVSDQKISYNMEIHPQDKYLVVSSDGEDRKTPSKKRRKLAHQGPNADDGSGSAKKVAKKSKPSLQERSRRSDFGTSGGLDSSDAPVFPSVETGNDAIATTKFSHISVINSPPGHGIRRQEGMEVWHYHPRKRYLNHNRDYWPTFPDQPFEIFQEHQLAPEAMEASPLDYEHDNKENITNTGLEHLYDDYSGISVTPSAQNIQSSDERQLANHRALVSEALYSDEAPQSYGLDGNHDTCEVLKDAPMECMDLLASGWNLPPGPTQTETRTESQDSVLDSDLFSEIRGSEL
ncbi:hypothetical protein G6011_03154 [Alternaria panax]|uniref:Uncharacterized protein n=1 Tax=Alternaria panax TaxID=48097 RepID=A0AAD4NSV2_9PLEO|nr:hypothetical protein G6011_03154 [Alternaria panax]